MKKFGLIVAVETLALEKFYGEADEIINCHNREVSVYKKDNYEIYVVKTGAGEIGAASATQLLVSEFDVEAILNFGVVGALTDYISEKKLCLVKDVVHYDYDISEVDGYEVGRYSKFDSIYIPATESLYKRALEINPDIELVTIASGDKFVGNEKEKRSLNERFNADICDMESAGILITALENDVPVLMLKMVSDSVKGGLDEYSKELLSASYYCIEVFSEIIESLFD